MSDRMAKRSLFVSRKQDKLSKPIFISKSKDLEFGCSNERSYMSTGLANNMMTSINLIREMIVNKVDPYVILEKIVNELSGNYEKSCEIIRRFDDSSLAKCSDLHDQVISLESDMLNKIQKVEQHSENSVDSIDLSLKCKDEVNILWLSFTDPAEINNLNLKNKSDLIQETKKIFNRMNIKLDKPHKAIIDVQIQKVSVKTDKIYENELILGVKFTNSIVVSYLKRQITEYGKKEFINENYDLIRYSVRNFWSRKIWKLLRVCYDLKNFEMIEKVNVMDQGITVTYKKSKNLQNNQSPSLQKKLIRNESDLNVLRSEVNDICDEISTFQLYNGDYFKLSFNERKAFKDGLLLSPKDNEINIYDLFNRSASSSKGI